MSDNENQRRKSTETEQNRGNIDKNSEEEVWKLVKWEGRYERGEIREDILCVCIIKGSDRSRRGRPH